MWDGIGIIEGGTTCPRKRKRVFFVNKRLKFQNFPHLALAANIFLLGKFSTERPICGVTLFYRIFNFFADVAAGWGG